MSVALVQGTPSIQSQSTMTYPRINLIHLLIILLGLHPFKDHHQSRWFHKIHQIGILFCLIQILMTIYTFYLEQQNRDEYYNSFDNHILHGTIVTRKFFAIFLPLASILCKFLKLRPLEEFWKNLHLLDEFLKDPQRQSEVSFNCLAEETQRKIERVNLLSGVGVIVAEVVNLIISVGSMLLDPHGSIEPWYTFYFYHSMITIHLTINLHIFATFYAVTLRQELYCNFVQKISDIKWPSVADESEERRQRINKVFLWGLGKWTKDK